MNSLISSLSVFFTNEGNESIPEAEWMHKGPTGEQLCDLEITKE